VFQQQGDALRRREERFAREHQIEIARQNGLATNGSATQWQTNSLARRLGAGAHHKKPWAMSEPEPVHDPVSLGFSVITSPRTTPRVGPEVGARIRPSPIQSSSLFSMPQ
jgi:hypothetical protein